MKKKLSGMVLTFLLLLSCLLFAFPAAADGHEVTLTVNGSSSSQTVQANQNNMLVIRAPGATAVRLYDPDDDRYEYYDRYETLDYLEIRWRYGEVGTKRIYAEARYDDYEDGTDLSEATDSTWEESSSTIRLSVTAGSGDFPTPAVSLSASSVAQGGWLTATVTNAPGEGEWYWADLWRTAEDEDSEDEYIGHFDFNSKNEIAVCAADYEPGSYRLEAGGTNAGYRASSTGYAFTITENENLGRFFEVSTGEASVSEDVFLCACVPDEADRAVEWMRLLVTKQGNPSWGNDRRDWDGGTVQDWWSSGEEGTFDFTLLAMYEGDADATLIGTESVTFAAEAGTDPLSKPDLSDFSGLLSERLDEDGLLPGTVAADERTEWFDISIEYVPDEGDWVSVYNARREAADGTDWNVLGLPAEIFAREGRYRMSVSCHAYGIPGNDAFCVFLKTSAQKDSNVALTVNGDDGEFQVWESGTNLRAAVTAPGATAVRLLREDRWDYQDCPNGRLTWDMGFGEGDMTFVAQITTDAAVWREDGFDWDSFRWEDLTWTDISNVVRIRSVSPNGFLGTPEVTVSPASGEVLRGGLLTVEGISQGHDEWLYADMMVLNADDPDNWWWETAEHFDSAGDPLSLTIPTAAYEPGEYYLKVGMDAQGWQANEIYLPVTVLENDDMPEVLLTLSRNTMQANEDLWVYAYAEGTSWLDLEIRWDQDGSWQDGRSGGGESASWSWGCGSGGLYTFALTAYFPEEDGRDPVTVTQELTVTSDGQLDAPVISGIPAVISTGEGVSGSFSAIAGAGWYNVELNYAPEDGDWDQLYWDERSPSDEGAADISLDGGYFSAPGRYRLSVNAAAVGVDNGYAELWILVLEDAEPDDSFTLSLFGTTDESEIGELVLYQEVKAALSGPDGMTAARVWDGSSWDYMAGLDESYHRNYSAYQEGSMTYVAQATTDAAVSEWGQAHEDDFSEFDWSEVNWSLTSNTMTIQVVCYGSLDAPTVNFTDGTEVERGEYLALTIDPVENGWGFGVRIESLPDEDGRIEIFFDGEFGPDEEILIPTDAMAEGTYTLVCESRRYGWRGQESRCAFTVTEPAGYADEAVFKISKTAVLTNEAFAVSVYAPGAEEVCFCHEALENDWQRGGNRISYMTSCEDSGSYSFRAFARYVGEDEWSEIGDGITVEVSAPYGAPDCSIEVPEVGSAGEELAFSVTWIHGGLGIKSGVISVYDSENQDILDGDDGWDVTDESIGETENVFSFVFHAGALSPGSYRVETHMVPAAQGYDPIHFSKTFFITEDASVSYDDLASPSVWMSGIWYAGQNLHFRIEQPDAEYIHIWIADEDMGDLIFSNEIQGYDYRTCDLPESWFVPGHRYSLTLKSVEITDGAYHYDNSVLYLSMLPENPEVLTLPSMVDAVEAEAFEGTGARMVEIPNGISSIGPRAFGSCPNLSVVLLPSDTSGIAADAFEGSGEICGYAYAGAGAQEYASRSGNVSVIYLEA